VLQQKILQLSNSYFRKPGGRKFLETSILELLQQVPSSEEQKLEHFTSFSYHQQAGRRKDKTPQKRRRDVKQSIFLNSSGRQSKINYILQKKARSLEKEVFKLVALLLALNLF
jgi:hypothetical protein